MTAMPTLSNRELRRASFEQAREARRRAIEAREVEATGGIEHVGHLPIQADEIEGWTFRRCRCGFTLALSEAGRVWWLRAANPAVEIPSLGELLKALAKDCRFHLRRKPASEAQASASTAAGRTRAEARPEPRADERRAKVAAKPIVVVKPRRA